jgi:hypothetical protein
MDTAIQIAGVMRDRGISSREGRKPKENQMILKSLKKLISRVSRGLGRESSKVRQDLEEGIDDMSWDQSGFY